MPPFGDIYIGIDVAKRQAKEAGHPLRDELVILAVHGALHLAGCEDKKPGERKRMFASQDKIVAGLLPKKR